MGFVKQLLLFGTYFLLLSTTLQSEDAYVFFYDSEYSQEDDQNPVSRIRQLIIFGIFTLLYYLTVFITPYLKLPIRKLAIGSCIILLGKYGCELATYTNIMINIFQLAAIFMDIIGTAVFYLSSVRALQILCEKYEYTEQSGKIFGMAAGMFGLSVIFGYAIAYGCFRQIPLWAYVIVLTCMTIISGVICFFALPIERRAGPANQLQQQIQQPQSNQPAQQNQQAPSQVNNQQSALEQIYRDNMTLGQVVKNTWFMYKKMFIIIPIQMNLGFIISYGGSLLEYLVWTTQSESQSLRLLHNLDIILLYGGSAIIASLIFGVLCDMFSVKRVGFAVIALTAFTLSFLYMGIFSKTFPATMVLYVFVGLSTFGLGVWLLCVSSKVFGGKFQAFANNAQFIGLASAMYQVAVILFQGRIDMEFKLCFQLASLILSTLGCIFLIRKLPQGQIDIIFEQSQMEESQVTQRRAQPQREIEMIQSNNTKKIEEQLQTKDNQKSVDPDFLL